jgi:hypothetical protein
MNEKAKVNYISKVEPFFIRLHRKMSEKKLGCRNGKLLLFRNTDLVFVCSEWKFKQR